VCVCVCACVRADVCACVHMQTWSAESVSHFAYVNVSAQPYLPAHARTHCGTPRTV
jgi:hypothetical protein